MTVGNRGLWRGQSKKTSRLVYDHRTPISDLVQEIDLTKPHGYWPISLEAPATAQLIFGGDLCPDGMQMHMDGAGGAALRGIAWPMIYSYGDCTIEAEMELHVFNSNYTIAGIFVTDDLAPSHTLLAWSHGYHGNYGAPPWALEYGAGFGTSTVASSNGSSMMAGGRGWVQLVRVASATSWVSGVSAYGGSYTYRGGVSEATLGWTPRFFGVCWYHDVAVQMDLFVHKLRQYNKPYPINSMGSIVEVPSDALK